MKVKRISTFLYEVEEIVSFQTLKNHTCTENVIDDDAGNFELLSGDGEKNAPGPWNPKLLQQN